MKGTLLDGEPHPSATSALYYMHSLPPAELFKLAESFASCAIEGNRVGDVCGETLRRLMHGEPISDRYLLGLAWFVRYTIMEDKT